VAGKVLAAQDALVTLLQLGKRVVEFRQARIVPARLLAQGRELILRDQRPHAADHRVPAHDARHLQGRFAVDGGLANGTGRARLGAQQSFRSGPAVIGDGPGERRQPEHVGRIDVLLLAPQQHPDIRNRAAPRSRAEAMGHSGGAQLRETVRLHDAGVLVVRHRRDRPSLV